MRCFNSIYVKRFLSVIIIIALLLATELYLGNALKKVNFSYYYNHEMNKIYNDGQDIDILFVGTSRIYRGFDPKVLEDKMGLNCVVVSGAASATTMGIYYLLKDITESCNVHRVVIGVSFDDLTRSEYTQNITHANLLILDRLNKLRNKLGLIWNGLKEEDKLYALNLYRYRNGLNDINDQAIIKKNAEMNNYHGDMEEDEYYWYHGFVYSKTSIKTGNMTVVEKNVSKEEINDINFAYFDKSVALCKNAGIKVDLVTSPVSDMLLFNTNDYQTSSDYFSAYANSHGINYYDLNLLKNREEFLADEMFKDAFHLNGQGASRISDIFADILKDEQDGKSISGYFYDNIDQFKESVGRIAAVEANLNYDYYTGSLDVTMESLHNEETVPEYRVEFKHIDADDYDIIQDWSTESELHLDLDKMSHGELIVRSRTSKGDSKEAFQCYSF